MHILYNNKKSFYGYRIKLSIKRLSSNEFKKSVLTFIYKTKYKGHENNISFSCSCNLFLVKLDYRKIIKID